MTYDPREHGCLCDTCDLNKETPVPPEIRPGTMLVIGEAPGNEETKQGRPFVGASGVELVRTLGLHGKSRHDVSLTNVLLCRPPGVNMKVYLRRLAKRQAKAESASLPIPLSPLRACRPRLDAEIAAAPAVLALGATAAAAVSGDRAGEAGLLRMRGFPARTPAGQPIVSTFHPAFVMRARRFTETFRSDVAKAFRHAEGRLGWIEPEIIVDPTPGQLDAVLERMRRYDGAVAIDTETDGLDPESVDLRCVGLAAAGFGVVVGFRSIENPPRKWKCDPEYARGRIREFFADPGTGRRARLCGHNVNLYDRPVLRRHGMPLPPPEHVGDTLIASHVADSELPHDLDYLASRFTDARKWKPGIGHDEWKSDLDLHKYCGLDCAVTARLVPDFERRVIGSDQGRVYRSDIGLQALCLGMHRAGMLVDEEERRRHEVRLRVQMKSAEDRALAMTGGWKLNLNSPNQVRDYLFDKLGLPLPTIMTEDDEPSTSKDALYEILARGLPPKTTDFILALIEFRQAARSLAKDVLGLSIGQDGRVHPTWSPHTVVTGRVSCGDPNVANVPSVKQDPDSLRSMYVAAPGSSLVVCDLEQAELRVVAALAGDPIWLEAFAKGDDVHVLNACAFFNCTRADVSKSLRDFAKTACYLFLYGGLPAKATQLMRRVINPKTRERPYAGLTVTEVAKIRDRFLKVHPLERWWDRTLAQFRATGMLRSPLLGRVRRFLDGGLDDEAVNEIRNFRVQSCISDVVSGELACGTLMESVGWPWTRPGGLGGAGIVHNGYDSMTVEVASSHAVEAGHAVEAAMRFEGKIDGQAIVIPSKAKIGKRWSECV